MKVYEITQTNNARIVMNIVFPVSESTTVILDNIRITGNISLENNAFVKLFLSGSNDISGSIFTPPGVNIEIDSAISAGSTGGSLTVTATSSDNAGIGGKLFGGCGGVTIHGGTVTATGGANGAGIGGGLQDGNESCNITIHGGTVTATGGSNGAGIGGSFMGRGGTIAIHGGTVTATSVGAGSGIGGGSGGGGGNISIAGGTVTAIGNNGGAGIGAGSHISGGGNISITGGTVTATGKNGGAGIGGGDASVIGAGNISITGGNVTATAIGNGAGIGSGSGGKGAMITTGKEATIKAYSTGSYPAIHASGLEGNNYLVNVSYNPGTPLADTDVLVYIPGKSGVYATLNAPDGCKSFAFLFPNTTSKENYNLSLQSPDGTRQIHRSSDASAVIPSISELNGYDEYNGDAGNGVLPVGINHPVFVSVTDIVDVPSKAIIGKDLTLSGRVNPSNATNNNIVWTVTNAGATGAEIAGNKLSATGEGTVVVTATIANGITSGVPFKQDFTVTVNKVEGSFGSMLIWIVIAIVVIAVLAVALFFLHKKGKI